MLAAANAKIKKLEDAKKAAEEAEKLHKEKDEAHKLEDELKKKAEEEKDSVAKKKLLEDMAAARKKAIKAAVDAAIQEERSKNQ